MKSLDTFSGTAPALRGGASLLGIAAGAIVLSGLLSAAGCSFDAKANNARGCDGCAPGMCVLNYRLQAADVDGGPGDTAGTGDDGTGGSADTGGGNGGKSGMGGTGSKGAVNNGGGGASGAGGAPGKPCEAGAKPTDETCNGADDDCDGEIDEDLVLGSCAGQGDGACGSGVIACENGQEVCKAGDGKATAEVCNGLDDDCDGEVDDIPDVPCYPDDTAGCETNDDGDYDCVGACAAGTRSCKGGKLSECTGFVKPTDGEVCDKIPAKDDDCNGKVDDKCPCNGAVKQNCFPGPGLVDIGRCKHGTQECSDGVWGDCTGAVVGRTETCANMGIDDDCDFAVDDVFAFYGLLLVTLGDTCDLNGKQGVCATGTFQCKSSEFTCVGPEPKVTETVCDMKDEDCDGNTDEVFQFATDEMHCGNCTTACDSGDLCCGSDHCVSLGTKAHCTSCDACPGAQECCDDGCVALGTEDHCTSCAGCGDGQTCCGAAGCVTLGTDANCSECGDTCDGDEDCCNGTCTKVGTPDNCSGCGNTCGEGAACCGTMCMQGGCSTCDPVCEGTDVCCGGACGPLPETGICPP